MIVVKRVARLSRRHCHTAWHLASLPARLSQQLPPLEESERTLFTAKHPAVLHHLRSVLEQLLDDRPSHLGESLHDQPAHVKRYNSGGLPAEALSRWLQPASRLHPSVTESPRSCPSSAGPAFEALRTWQRLLSVQAEADKCGTASGSKSRVQQPSRDRSSWEEAGTRRGSNGEEAVPPPTGTVQGSGWTWEEVANWPNAISAARLLAGPPLALLVLHDHMGPALAGLALAGASDWLDGYVARRWGINSVLGSYLDPLADKVLIGCVALALLLRGLLPGWLVLLTLGRDAALLGGAFLHRARSLHWRWRSPGDFFRIASGGAETMQPLLVSKVNTVLQLALLGTALLEATLQGEMPQQLLPLLSVAVGGTTCLSGVAYAVVFVRRSRKLSNVTAAGPP